MPFQLLKVNIIVINVFCKNPPLVVQVRLHNILVHKASSSMSFARTLQLSGTGTLAYYAFLQNFKLYNKIPVTNP